MTLDFVWLRSGRVHAERWMTPYRRGLGHRREALRTAEHGAEVQADERRVDQ